MTSRKHEGTTAQSDTAVIVISLPSSQVSTHSWLLAGEKIKRFILKPKDCSCITDAAVPRVQEQWTTRRPNPPLLYESLTAPQTAPRAVEIMLPAAAGRAEHRPAAPPAVPNAAQPWPARPAAAPNIALLKRITSSGSST